MECKALRTSTVKLKMFNEIVKTLGNVRYELGRNLISLGRLVFWGMDILQEAELWNLLKVLVVMKWEKALKKFVQVD